MSGPDFGTFQILISSTDPGATTAGDFAQYTTFLSGQYGLRLINIQINSTQGSPAVRPVQVAFDNIGNWFGVQYPTILYPARTEDLIGNYEIEFVAQLQSSIRVQIREITGLPMTEFAYAVLTFKYERM